MFKKTILFSFVIIFNLAFSQIKFDDYFFDKSLRLDYYHVGDINKQEIAFDELIEEPYWAGPKQNLIDKFKYGNYFFELIDSASGKVIFSKGYSTLFSEWITTAEAKLIKKAFSETIVMPFPKKKAIAKFYTRNKKNTFDLTFSMEIDPTSPYIKKDRRFKYNSVKLQYKGDAANKVDIVIIPDGYTKSEEEKLKKDFERFINYLFGSSPYKENKDNFNIWTVDAYSEESGVDIPRENIYKNTLVNASFYTFDLERYCMVEDNKKLRDVAGNVPYDQIYVLVNTTKYGGGAIYNHYSVTVSDNKAQEYIIVHEFGHGFAGLGDEYYSSAVAYEEFYKLDVEPWEPNLTTLVDFDKKWKSMMDKNTPIPTPPTPENAKVVGVYEGGGYVTKGVYRPYIDCTMKSISVDNFCPVCRKAIQDMIDFYTESK